MTTTIEKRIFGILVEKKIIKNQSVRISTGNVNGQHIEVLDQDFGRTTYVRELHMSTTEIVANVFDADSRPVWEVDREVQLANGESTIIGPERCKLTIIRE